MREEIVLCAAIHVDDGKKYQGQPVNIETGLCLVGHRHGNCFQLLEILDALPAKHFKGPIVQGFLTSRNRFVERKIAYNIARKRNQIISENKKPGGYLISEDLY